MDPQMILALAEAAKTINQMITASAQGTLTPAQMQANLDVMHNNLTLANQAWTNAKP